MKKKIQDLQTNKKTILVYGDSNTWGLTDKMTRYPFRVRWTSQLQRLLGNSYEVIGAGVPGGVAGDYPQANLIKRRRSSFDLVYRLHLPVDILIIALGTNDLRHEYSRTPEQIRDDLLWYGEKVKSLNNQDGQVVPTKVIYLLPSNCDFNLFPASSEKRSELIRLMQQATDSIILADDIDLGSDGVHFSQLGHEQMAQIVFDKIQKLLKHQGSDP